jgi:hypothetical protein
MVLCSRHAGETVRGMVRIRIPTGKTSIQVQFALKRAEHTLVACRAGPQLDAARQGECTPAGLDD